MLQTLRVHAMRTRTKRENVLNINGEPEKLKRRTEIADQVAFFTHLKYERLHFNFF